MGNGLCSGFLICAAGFSKPAVIQWVVSNPFRGCEQPRHTIVSNPVRGCEQPRTRLLVQNSKHKLLHNGLFVFRTRLNSFRSIIGLAQGPDGFGHVPQRILPRRR